MRDFSQLTPKQEQILEYLKENILAKGYAIAIFHGIREILKISDMDTENLKRITKIYLNSYLSMLDFNIDRYAL